jgi:hypothetical protein
MTTEAAAWPSITIAEFRADGSLVRETKADADTSSSECIELNKILRPGEGANYKGQGPGRFAKLMVQVTNGASGVGLATVWSGKYLHGSAVYVSGQSPSDDAWILDTFYKSMDDNNIVKRYAAPGTKPFDALLTLRGRPMCAFVIWPWTPVESDYPLTSGLLTSIGHAMYFQAGYRRPTA